MHRCTPQQPAAAADHQPARRRLACLRRHVRSSSPELTALNPHAKLIGGPRLWGAANGPAAALGSRIPPVSALPLAAGARRLTADEIVQFRRRGFVSGLPVLAPEAGEHLVAKYAEIAARLAALPQPLSTNEVFFLFKASRWIYDLTMLSAIHNYVEDLIGPNFFLCECLRLGQSCACTVVC